MIVTLDAFTMYANELNISISYRKMTFPLLMKFAR
jgi:hypothetical protein